MYSTYCTDDSSFGGLAFHHFDKTGLLLGHEKDAKEEYDNVNNAALVSKVPKWYHEKVSKFFT